MQSEINADDFFDSIEEEKEAQASPPLVEQPAAKPDVSADEFFGYIEAEEREASKAVLSKDPGLASREREAAKQMETSRTDASANLEEYESVAKRNEMQEKLKDAPVFTGFLANNQADAPILQNDVDFLIDIEKRLAKFGVTESEEGDLELDATAITGWQAAREDVTENAVKGFESGYAMGEEGIAYAGVRDNKIKVDDVFKAQSAEREKKMKAMEGNESFVAEAAQIVGTMVAAFRNSANETAAASGAVVGAAMATGFAAPAAATVAGAMMMGGSLRAMYDMEGGLAYKDMIEKGARPDEAKLISQGVGLVNSLIEFGGVTLMGKAFAPVLRVLAAKNTAKVAAALSEPSMTALLKESSKAMAKSIGAEVTTEVMQELVNVAGEGLAKEFADAQFDDITLESLWDRLSEIAIKTAKGMVVLGALGMGPTVAMGARKVMQAREAEAFFTALNDGMTKSEAKQIAPDVLAGVVQQMSEEARSGVVYVDAAEFQQAMIEHGITAEQIDEIVPGMSQTLAQKALNKQDLVFPTGQYAAKVAGTDLGKTLVQHVRLDQDALSVADAVKLHKEQAKMLRDIMSADIDPEEIEKRVAQKDDAFKAEYEKVKQSFIDGLTAANTAGKKTTAEIKHEAKYGAWIVTNFAKRSGLDPEMIGRLAPSIRSAMAPAEESDLVQTGEEVLHQIRTKEAPKKTRTVYKLFRIRRDKSGDVLRDKNGNPNLYPLFIDSNKPVNVGTWYDADSPDISTIENLDYGDWLVAADGTVTSFEEYAKAVGTDNQAPGIADVNYATDNGARWIRVSPPGVESTAKARYGVPKRFYNLGISVGSSGKKVATYALRPGWHAGTAPTMRQVGLGSGDVRTRSDDQVWVQIEVPMDINYDSPEYDHMKSPDGDMIYLPTDGTYTYATNPIQFGEGIDWVISGAFKPVRIMSDAEAAAEVERQNREETYIDRETGEEKRKAILPDWLRAGGRVFNNETMKLEGGDPNYVPPGAKKKRAKKEEVLEQKAVVHVEKDNDWRVLTRTLDNMTKEERAVFNEYINSRPDADRVLANLERLNGTPWSKQAIEAVFVRAAMGDLMAGREPRVQSMLDNPQLKQQRDLLKNGTDGLWEILQNNGFVGNASKPAHNVNSSFLNCDPSNDCAKFCYATKGNYNYAASVVKSELVSVAVALDPARAAQMTATQYKGMAEFHLGKALRLFDKGDGDATWIPYIEALNKEGVRVQIFSKRPDFLRQVSDFNLRLLSIDESNKAMADENPDLPVAFVYSTEKQIPEIVELFKRGQLQVVLPVKEGRNLLDAAKVKELIKQDKNIAKHVCPIDAGWKNIKTKKNPEGWNCTMCDKNAGVGCFVGSTTSAVMDIAAKAEAKINTMGVTSLSDLISQIENVKKELDDAIESMGEQGDAAARGTSDERGSIRGSSGGARAADVSHQLDQLLQALFSRINARAERNGSQRISAALGGALQDGTQGAAGLADIRDGLAAEGLDGGSDLAAEQAQSNESGGSESASGGSFVLKQVIGVNGAEAIDKAENAYYMFELFVKAREMEEAGFDAKAIRDNTGWERGHDGKWRYEIDDLIFKNGIEFDDIVIKNRAAKSVKLKDAIEAEDLFKAYSFLEDYELVVLDLPPRVEGWVSHGEKRIYMTSAYWDDDVPKGRARSVMVHEVQHAIQRAEGFEVGGDFEKVPTPEGWTGTKEELAKYKKDIYRRLRGEVEARNVVKRMLNPELRVKLLSATEDVSAEYQLTFAEAYNTGTAIAKSLDQIAWHGSPYRFSKFLLEKIGTGEGAQAHGWGLYFALNRATAEEYRERLSSASEDPEEAFIDWCNNFLDPYIPGFPNIWSIGYGIDDFLWFLDELQGETWNTEERLIDWGDYSIYVGDLEEARQHAHSGELISLEDFREYVVKPNKELFKSYSLFLEEVFHGGGGGATGLLKFVEDNKESLDDEFLSWFDTEAKSDLMGIARLESGESDGALYMVDIPEDEVMLEEGDPLWKQPEFVRNAVVKLMTSAEISAGDVQSAIDRSTYALRGALELLFKYSNGHADLGMIANALEPVLRASLKQVKDDESKEAFIRKVTPTFMSVLNIKKPEGDKVRSEQIDHVVDVLLHRAIRELGMPLSEEELIEEDPMGFEIYDRLTRRLGSPKAASLKLLEYGIKGIRYDGRQDGPCAVVFDEDAVNILEMMQAEQDKFKAEVEKANMQTTGTYSITNNTITLTPNANLSTFAHEMGHWYLETLFSVYDLKGVSASVRADVEVMLKDFGLNSVEAWYALPMKDREVFHERFAFYVEQYLAEGKAPTKETRGFFSRFGKWIRSVYNHFTGGAKEELDALYRERFDIDLPPMSDEVRRVLDRMIAAESAIKTAEQAEGIMHLFEQKPADMSDDDWQQYMQERDDAESEAADKVQARMARDEKWFANARSKKLKEIQEKGKEIRSNIRAKVVDEVDDMPEVKALAFIKANKMKFSEDDLRMTGISAAMIQALRKNGLTVANYTVKGNYSQVTVSAARQLVAFARKYTNDKKFLTDLLTACDREKLIDDVTTQRCLEKHGEMFDQKKINNAVAEAIHNEARSRMIATELSYLANDKEGRSRIYREAARRTAEEMVAGMPIGSVKVRKFIAAEARASRKAFEALAKGDRYAAVLAKRAQLVNHEAALIAIDIEKQMRSVTQLKSRIFRADKKLAKTHDIDIINIARYVLTNEGLGRGAPSTGTPMAAIKYVEKLEKYDPEKFAIFTNFIEKHAYKGDIDFAKFSTRYAMEVVEDVQMLYGMARASKEVLLDGKRIDRQEVVNELITQFDGENRTKWNGGEDRVASAKQHLAFNWMNFKSKMMRVESWCRAMDGGVNGPFFNYIFLPISNAAAKFRNTNTKTQEALIKVVKPMMAKWFPVREIEAPEIGYTFATKAELIGAVLHTGNMSNKHKMLLGGRGEGKSWGYLVELQDGSNFVDTSNWDAFFNRCMQEGIITKEDMDTVQAIWDLTEATKPIAQAAFKQMYGTYFEEVEATEVVTPWGNYRGGYVPAITDKLLVADKQAKDEAKRISEQDFISQMPVHQPGFSKSRVPNYTKPLALDVGLICGHVQEVLKFAIIAPVAQEVGKIISDRNFVEVIEQHNPTWVTQMLVPWLKRSYEQTVTDGKSDIFSNKLNQLRGIAGMNIMAGHIVNALQQWTGLSIAATKVNPRFLAKAHVRLMGNDFTIGEMMEMSPFMKARLEDRAIEFQSQIERIVRTSENVKQAKGLINKAAAIDEKFDPARDWINRHGYFLQTAMQAPIDAIAWCGAYMQAIDQGMEHDKAVAEADSVVRTTMSDFAPENVAGIETGGALYRCFLVFYNYFNMQANLLGESWEVAKKTKKYGKFALDSMFIVAIPSIISAILTQMIQGFDTGDDDEWDTYDMLRLLIAEPLKNVFAMAPFLGGAINSAGAGLANADVAWAQFVWGEDPYQSRLMNAPAFDAIGTGGSSLLQWLKAAEGDDFNARGAVRGTLDLLSIATRVPFGALKKPLGYAAGVANDEIQPDSILDIARGLISGKDTSK